LLLLLLFCVCVVMNEKPATQQVPQTFQIK
jgi:hypothetical protein